jgi:CarD family transcriptional regulator
MAPIRNPAFLPNYLAFSNLQDTSLLALDPPQVVEYNVVSESSPHLPTQGYRHMSSANVVFHIGDKVVYPNHGVGVIEQISSRAIGANIERFYLLHIKASSLKVMVPCNNAGSVGMRKVVRNGEIQKVLDLLSGTENGSNGDWKDRFKENSDRMRTGSLFEVAGVLKSLIALHQAKPLSFREKKMLERARYLLVSELALARNCEESKIEEVLTTALAKCKLRFPEASDFAA